MDGIPLLLIIEAIPLGILIGIAAATIGYTAWGIVVPLLFVGFGYDIYDALFISIAVDLINSAVLSLFYYKKDKVNIKHGLIYGGVAILGCIIGLILSVNLLAANQHLFKGGAAYLFFVLGVFFIYRGYRMGIKEKRKTNIDADGKTGGGIDKAAPIIMVIGTLLSGILSGFIGIGSGTNFFLLLIITYGITGGYDTLKATGTACFIMLTVAAFLTVAFALLSGNVVAMIFILILFVLPSLLGTIIGSKIALTVNESVLNYIIGCAILLVAVVSTLQAAMLGSI